MVPLLTPSLNQPFGYQESLRIKENQIIKFSDELFREENAGEVLQS
jgi:hypothetical protein